MEWQLMDLHKIVGGIEEFHAWSHGTKIALFAWHIHENMQCDRFNIIHIKDYYEKLHLEKPANFSHCLSTLSKKKPKVIVKDGSGYYLVRSKREEFSAKYGSLESTIHARDLLLDLPSQIADFSEQIFLQEAIICFVNGAFRAAIVMTWNLAFDHLCNYIVDGQLDEFNVQVAIRFANNRKYPIQSISKKEDFEKLKESEIIEVCQAANIISGSVCKILREKLIKRNSAAHPSDIVMTQIQAEDFITDLVNNVVLKLV
jgi:hypothetical protein